MKQNRAIIQVKKLRQFYKNFAAVNDIDFEVYPGEIFGLIGTNGAGKTSIIKALAGVQPITYGTVEIMGKHPSIVRSSLGYLTQQFSLYSDLSIDENLRYYVKTRRLPEEIFQSRRKQYLQWLGLKPFANRLAGHLSGGMKQKLALCCILITQPRILLLDEVSTGIDAVSRHEIWSFLSKIARAGTTIVVSTHYLDEAERCDRVALIHRGTIKEIGTPEELKNRIDLQCFEVVPDDPFLASGAIFAATEQALKNEIATKPNSIVDVQSLGDRLVVFLHKEVRFPEKKIQEILNFHQLPVTSINPDRPTLENVMAYNLQETSSAKARFPEVGSVSSLPSIDNFGSNWILNVDGASKAYGKFQAVQPLNLRINRGEICGLLGANGAGKTTLMKLLCGLLVPSRGKIGFTSEYLSLSSPSVKQKIGYMSQKFALYPSLTILENLSFFGRAYGVSNQQLKTRIAWLLETFDLTGHANVRVANLSGGNKQRVAFGAAILHQPDILFLDEPTSGMDILVRRHFWQILQKFARQGTAIVVTTHSMEEAEYCTNLLFMRSGKLIVRGSPKNIKMQQKGVLVEILSNSPKKNLYNLEQQFEPWRIILMSDRIQIILEQPSDISRLENYLAAVETESYQITPIPFSLEAAFLKIAKHP
ncbi:ATP-binding cassette domain-containing protein [Calothrix rhizosoleniae]|uniref:ATP-binding cassette domain-containing protein n=1 Tax=Calothrix rhizosoleniae TaxID=888997 RepID=UPI000B498DB2|nr:ATP-binding cassette domain-containing protein [Calothrix rhizosoleniae]